MLNGARRYGWQNDPTALAIGVLVTGGGALLLSSLFGIWVSFSIISAIAVAIAIGAESQRRREAQREREQQEWNRIVRDEWGC